MFYCRFDRYNVTMPHYKIPIIYYNTISTLPIIITRVIYITRVTYITYITGNTGVTYATRVTYIACLVSTSYLVPVIPTLLV